MRPTGLGSERSRSSNHVKVNRTSGWNQHKIGDLNRSNRPVRTRVRGVVGGKSVRLSDHCNSDGFVVRERTRAGSLRKQAFRLPRRWLGTPTFGCSACSLKAPCDPCRNATQVKCAPGKRKTADAVCEIIRATAAFLQGFGRPRLSLVDPLRRPSRSGSNGRCHAEPVLQGMSNDWPKLAEERSSPELRTE